MKKFALLLATGAALILAVGCSTPAARIHDHQAAFDTWPADVREKIRAGHVAVEFTPEMVQVALGQPDRVFARTTEKGSSEVWVYLDSGPKFSIGIGVGGSSGSAAYGGGVILSDEGFRENEVLRVIFEGGRVVAMEARRR